MSGAMLTALGSGLLIGALTLEFATGALYLTDRMGYRLYLRLSIVSDVMFLVPSVIKLPGDPIFVVFTGVWVAVLIHHIRKLRDDDDDDDDDDQPKRRRRRLRATLRMPKIRLPRILLPLGAPA